MAKVKQPTCEAEHPIKTWPYVRRCRSPITEELVWIKELGQQMDLCDKDYESYLRSLPKHEADDIRQYRTEALKRKS